MPYAGISGHANPVNQPTYFLAPSATADGALGVLAFHFCHFLYVTNLVSYKLGTFSTTYDRAAPALMAYFNLD